MTRRGSFWDRDAEIRWAVRVALADDPCVDSSAIDVDVLDGVVILNGEVASYFEARYAWDDAWETEGVRGVVDRLRVRTGFRDGATRGQGRTRRDDAPAHRPSERR